MQINALGLALIKLFESYRLTAYQDQRGIWTIGWGHTGLEVTDGLTITQEQADNWLASDIARTTAALSRMIKTAINENQFSALTSLAYNIGTGNFAASSTLALVNDGNISDVPAHIEMWNRITVNSQSVIDTGLVRRRAAEVSLFNTPV